MGTLVLLYMKRKKTIIINSSFNLIFDSLYRGVKHKDYPFNAEY